MENFDFIIFALFARVIGHVFFPPSIPEWLVLTQTFGLFAAGNLARPLGGIVLAHYGDKLGRKKTFIFSILMMAAATLGIAAAPTYATIGAGAPLILLVLRIVQGAAMGGELPGAWTFISEHFPKHRIGLACGFSLSAIAIGQSLGALVGVLLNTVFQPEEIASFAWRLPFLLGGILALLAVYLRRWLAETPVFEDMQRNNELAAGLPLKIVLSRYGGSVLICMVLTALLSIVIVVVFAMTPTLLQTAYKIDVKEALAANSLATVCMAAGGIAAGLLADRLGRGLFFILAAPVLATCTYLFYLWLPTHPAELYPLYALAGLSAGAIVGVPLALVSSFPPEVRFTGVSFSYNVSYAFFSGTTPPLIALAERADPLAHAHILVFACAAAFITGIALIFRDSGKAPV